MDKNTLWINILAAQLTASENRGHIDAGMMSPDETLRSLEIGVQDISSNIAAALYVACVEALELARDAMMKSYNKDDVEYALAGIEHYLIGALNIARGEKTVCDCVVCEYGND